MNYRDGLVNERRQFARGQGLLRCLYVDLPAPKIRPLLRYPTKYLFA